MKSKVLGVVVASAWCAAGLLFAGCPGPEYPNCSDDSQCTSHGEFCVNGRCQQCRGDTDCAEGKKCNEGRCDAIPGYCSATIACPAGQTCEGNRCVAAQSEAPPQETNNTPAQGPCQLNAVYYDFESSDLSGSARDALQANANCMRDRSIPHVHITGRADPRGTEEYNLALGDRRARSAGQFLQSLGVRRNQVSTSSRGEEDARGEDESGWTEDRRSDFAER